jgi:5-formyltetrahydrofolate cyclo-ligase
VNKKELREQLKQKLDSMNPETYYHHSSLIARHLYNQDQWKEHETIALTISRFPEVDTRPIIQKAWETGKRVVVPKCLPADRRMIFREITSFDQLEKVYFGLFEPTEKLTKEVSKEEIELIIVPGLGYTTNGSRLGFGGGYYDRYLKNYKGETLSLAFTEQLVQDLPIEDHDYRVGAIISEKGLISCTKRDL